MKERERIARVRLGSAAASIMNTGFARKTDDTHWMPWDVFPELQPEVEEDADVKGIRMMFHEMAIRQAARMKGNN